MAAFAYRGNDAIIDSIEGRLSDAGFHREGEVEIADAVITYCTNMTALEDLYFGDEGLIQVMQPGSIAIDLSPASCSFSSEISGVASVNDIKFVCAPIVVKNKVAEDAFKASNITCFYGMDENDVPEMAEQLIRAICDDGRETPNVAAAQLARAANVIQNTAEMVAAVETLSLFKKSASSIGGVELSRLVPEATSPEAFFIMKAIGDSDYTGAYTVEMLMGEISAAIMCADDCDLILPQAEAAFHLFELLAIVGGVDLSPAALELVYEGEGSEDAEKAGLDWSRMQDFYDPAGIEVEHGEYDADSDPLGIYGDEGDDYDDISSGFGYSVN